MLLTGISLYTGISLFIGMSLYASSSQVPMCVVVKLDKDQYAQASARTACAIASQQPNMCA